MSKIQFDFFNSIFKLFLILPRLSQLISNCIYIYSVYIFNRQNQQNLPNVYLRNLLLCVNDVNLNRKKWNDANALDLSSFSFNNKLLVNDS